MALMHEDRLALGAIEAALRDAREAEDRRPALEVLATSLAELKARGLACERSAQLVLREGGAWIAQLQRAQRSKTTVRAYRGAIDDLLAWAQRERRGSDLFERQGIIDYLDDYRDRQNPSPASYHHRFGLLRTFLGWVARRQGTPNPLLELEAPPDPRRRQRQLARTLITREEFAGILDAAEHPFNDRPGRIERDKLVLLAILLTGISAKELLAVRWTDVEVNDPRPTLIVHRGKREGHQLKPLPRQLVAQLRLWREFREPAYRYQERVLCGLAGGRMHTADLERIVRISASQAELEIRVSAHSLRESAARWLEKAGARESLICEYRGEETRISRHCPRGFDAEIRTAMQALADHALNDQPLAIQPDIRWASQ
jgi:integrase